MRTALEAILAAGAERAQAIAAETLADVRERMGVGAPGRHAPRLGAACLSGRGAAVGGARYLARWRSRLPCRGERMSLAALELDLDVFSGPFDLLLTLVLREEVDLLELQLAEVVLAYLDHLESRGELDLETATEFIVLIAALLELKSRLMLSGEEEELLDIEPEQAAEELLARMLDARRYRAAADAPRRAARGRARRALPRGAAAAAACAARSCSRADGSQDPQVLGEAIGRLLLMPPAISVRHIAVPRVTVAERLAHLRALLQPRRLQLRRGRARRRPDDGRGHAVRAARALQTRRGRLGAGARASARSRCAGALRRPPPAGARHGARGTGRARGVSDAGDATGFAGLPAASLASPRRLRARARPPREPRRQRDAAASAMRSRRSRAPSRRCCSCPRTRSASAELADASQAGEGAVQAALAVLAEQYAPGRRGIRLRELGGGWTLASDPDCEDAARRLFSRPRVSTLSPAQAETLAIVAYLQPISRPEITRIRGVSADSATATLLDRGLIEEAGHSQFGAVLYRTSTQFLKLFGLRSLEELPDIARWDPTPEEQADLRERLLRAGEARTGAAGG